MFSAPAPPARSLMSLIQLDIIFINLINQIFINKNLHFYGQCFDKANNVNCGSKKNFHTNRNRHQGWGQPGGARRQATAQQLLHALWQRGELCQEDQGQQDAQDLTAQLGEQKED